MPRYLVLIGQGAAAANDLTTLVSAVESSPPGQYQIFELIYGWFHSTRYPWGVAIRHPDGSVELRPGDLSQ